MVRQFRPDWCCYSLYLDTLGMYLTYNIEQRWECIYSLIQVGILRSLGALFGDGYAYIIYTGEGTGLSSALLQERGVNTSPH